MDLSKLSTADKLILGGGIFYLIAMFLPWYGISGFNNSGWSYFLGGWIPLILIIVMVAHVSVTQFSPDTSIPDPPVPWKHVHMTAGIVAAVIVLLRLLIGSDECRFNVCVDLDRQFGLFLAVIAVIVVAVGGYMKQQDVEATPSAGGDTGGAAPF